MSQPVSSEECEVLAALADPDATEVERSPGAVARRTGVAPKDAERILRRLEARSPPLVEATYDQELLLDVWTVTADGRASYDERCA